MKRKKIDYLNNKGQAVTAEYVMVFFLIIAVMSAMSVYVKRTLQARMYDARNKMVEFADVDKKEYEPYYQQTEAKSSRNDTTVRKLKGDVYMRDINTKASVAASSEVLDPSWAE